MASSRIKPSLLRKMTIRRVLECLQAQGPLSRADLTRETGISAPTVSKAVSSLLKMRLVEEGNAPENAVGRPGKRLQLAEDSSQIIGVVLDPEKSCVVVSSLSGRIDHGRTRAFQTPGSYAALLNALLANIQSAIESADRPTLGVGISLPGLHDDHRCLVSPNMPALDHQSPALDLADRLSLTVVGIQEARGLCLAERLYGDAAGRDDFAVLDFTTGLGMGAICAGRLLDGRNGIAGELGHITVDPSGRLCGCGNHGCLETLATDSALVAGICERLNRKMDIADVVRGLQQGTLQAREELNHVLEYQAIAIAAAINLLNPSHLYVHARVLEVSDDILSRVIRMTRRRTLDPGFEACEIKQAKTSKQQAAIASIVHHLTQSFGPQISD